MRETYLTIRNKKTDFDQWC